MDIEVNKLLGYQPVGTGANQLKLHSSTGYGWKPIKWIKTKLNRTEKIINENTYVQNYRQKCLITAKLR